MQHDLSSIHKVLKLLYNNRELLFGVESNESAKSICSSLQQALWRIQNKFENDCMLAKFLVQRYAESFSVSTQHAAGFLFARTSENHGLRAKKVWAGILFNNSSIIGELIQMHSVTVSADVSTILSIIVGGIFDSDIDILHLSFAFFERFCCTFNNDTSIQKLIWDWFAGGKCIGAWAMILAYRYHEDRLGRTLFEYLLACCQPGQLSTFFNLTLKQILTTDQHLPVSQSKILGLICYLMNNIKEDKTINIVEDVLNLLIDCSGKCILEEDRMEYTKALVYTLKVFAEQAPSLSILNPVFKHIRTRLRDSSMENQIVLIACIVDLVTGLEASQQIDILAVRSLAFCFMETHETVLTRDFLRIHLKHVVHLDAAFLCAPLVTHYVLLHISQWTSFDASLWLKIIDCQGLSKDHLMGICNLVFKMVEESNFWALALVECILELGNKLKGYGPYLDLLKDFSNRNRSNRELMEYVFGSLISCCYLSRHEIQAILVKELTTPPVQSPTCQAFEEVSSIKCPRTENFQEQKARVLGNTSSLPILKPSIRSPFKSFIKLDPGDFYEWRPFLKALFDSYGKTIKNINGEFVSGISLANWNRMSEDMSIVPMMLKFKTQQFGIFKRVSLDLLHSLDQFISVISHTADAVENWAGIITSKVSVESRVNGFMYFIICALLNKVNVSENIILSCAGVAETHGDFYLQLKPNVLASLGYSNQTSDGVTHGEAVEVALQVVDSMLRNVFGSPMLEYSLDWMHPTEHLVSCASHKSLLEILNHSSSSTITEYSYEISDDTTQIHPPSMVSTSPKYIREKHQEKVQMSNAIGELDNRRREHERLHRLERNRIQLEAFKLEKTQKLQDELQANILAKKAMARMAKARKMKDEAVRNEVAALKKQQQEQLEVLMKQEESDLKEMRKWKKKLSLQFHKQHLDVLKGLEKRNKTTGNKTGQQKQKRANMRNFLPPIVASQNEPEIVQNISTRKQCPKNAS